MSDLYVCVCGGVYGGRGLVHHQDFAPPPEQGPCQAEELPLANRKVASALAHLLQEQEQLIGKCFPARSSGVTVISSPSGREFDRCRQ